MEEASSLKSPVVQRFQDCKLHLAQIEGFAVNGRVLSNPRLVLLLSPDPIESRTPIRSRRSQIAGHISILLLEASLECPKVLPSSISRTGGGKTRE